jgi:hypothetical protein
MEALALTLRYEMLILLLALIGIIAYKLVVQQINVKGLLLDKTSGRAFSPARLQMLAVTLSIALYYTFLVIDSKESNRLPDLPNEFLLALAGSHSIYLSGKLYGALASRFGFASPRVWARFKPTERSVKK